MRKTEAEERERTIEFFRDDIYCEIDGFYVFGTKDGFLCAHHLRWIADELDKRNWAWNETINKYHEESKI